MHDPLNIEANRSARKWSRRELVGRLLWEASYGLFAISPRQFWVWRRMLLRLFGARVGRRVQIHPTVRIAVPWNLDIGDFAAVGDRAVLYSLGKIEIGAKATISQQAHLCAGTHDYRKNDLPLVKAPIVIGEGAWVCADAFVGPGVEIGAFAILGAAGVATRDVPEWTIWGGNPARLIKRREMQ